MENNGTDQSSGQGQSQGNDSVGSELMGSWGGGDAPTTTTPPAQQQQQQSIPPAQQQQGTPPVTPPAGTTPPASVPSAPTQASALSEADLTRIATVAARAAAPQPQQQQVAPLTDEQLFAHYGAPAVNADVMKAIFDPDPTKGALAMQKLLNQAVLSGVKMGNDLHSSGLDKLKGEFAPDVQAWRSHMAAQKEAATQGRFYAAHPDLANEKDLVAETLDALSAKVARKELSFTNEQEVFKAVADNVRRLVTRMGAPANNGQQHQVPSPQGSGGTRRPATLASQGRGGTGQQAGGPVGTLDKVVDSW